MTGCRTNSKDHLESVKKHGFDEIPFVIADGADGKDQVLVAIKNGKHFKVCRIGRKLTEQKQIIVMSHFKGHVVAGFGGAIKMLGIGFASRQGKMEAHCKNFNEDKKTINWGLESINGKLYRDAEFLERQTEYALAAVNKRQFLYLNFAIDIVKDCDCDGRPMKPIYKDLGVFASIDPVAIDKACYDLLSQREGKKPFKGNEIFSYAEKIGLGSQKYEMIKTSINSS